MSIRSKLNSSRRSPCDGSMDVWSDMSSVKFKIFISSVKGVQLKFSTDSFSL